MNRCVVKKPRLSNYTDSELLEPLCELIQDDSNCLVKLESSSVTSVTPPSPAAVASFATPTHLPEVPYQPDDVAPYYDRRRHHLFQKKWYNEYPWLHYDAESKGVYCFQCLSAVIKGRAEAPPNNIFARGGFRNWKKGVERFRVHENSQLHKDTAEFSVSRLMSQKANCAGLEVIVSSLRFLIGMGYDANSSGLVELLELRRKELPVLEEHLSKTVFSRDDELELVHIMATSTLRSVCQRVANDALFNITLETVPKVGMISVTVKTSRMLRPQEYFLGLYPLHESTLDELSRNLSFENLIAFACKSPDLKILENSLEKRCPNALNLSLSGSNLCDEVHNCLRKVRELGLCLNLIQLLIQVLSETDPQFLTSVFESDEISKSKTINFKTVQSILKNYSRILKKIREVSESPPWLLLPSLVVNSLEKRETVYNLLLFKLFFYPIENLSNLLEKAESIKGVKEAVSSISDIFCTYKSDADFNSFRDKYVAACKSIGLWNDVENNLEYFEKEAYFGAIGAIDEVLRRFMNVLGSKGVQDLINLEDTLTSCEEREDELLIAGNLPNVFNVKVENLNMEKRMLVKMMEKDGSELSVRACTRKLRLLERETTRLFPEIMKLADIFLAVQIAQEVDEIAPCHLRPLENFPTSNKSPELIRDLSIIYAYRDDSSTFNNKDIAQAFISKDPSRLETLFK